MEDFAYYASGYMQAMFNSMKNALATARCRFANLSGPLRLTVAVLSFIVAIVFLIWIFDKILLFLIARSYVDEIAETFDLNKNLATAIAWLVFAAIIILTRCVFSFSKSRRRAALVGLLALAVGHSLVLWKGTSDEIIDRSGKGLKCYVITRDGVHYRERPGLDPSTGRECKPVAPELVEKLREYEKGKRPAKIVANEPTFFDPATGEPIVWYLKTAAGQIELFDLIGFHPSTGGELLPITKEVANEWSQQRRKCVPALVKIGPDTRFFDLSVAIRDSSTGGAPMQNMNSLIARVSIPVMARF
jgi:hypothetical protein